MKLRKIFIAILTLALLLVSLPALSISAAGSPGQVEINKTAAMTGDREYTVTLTVNGISLTTANPADIILILDRSASMAWSMSSDNNPAPGEDSRMTILKAAANTFVDNVLASGYDNRVAVVAYSGNNGYGDAAWNDSQTLSGFSASASTVKGSYASLTPNGGTNMQAGFLEANTVMAGAREGVSKIVIFMTDGMPTFHYDVSGFTQGPGGSFDATGQANAIAQALALKGNYPETKIYTVGIVTSDVDGNIQNTLNPTGANQYQDAYYHTTSASGLNDIYTSLSETILQIATDAVVTDEITNGFTYVPGSLTPSAGTAEITGQVITWTLGAITEDVQTLTYRLRANDPVYGQAFTNKYATIDFTPVPENTFYPEGPTELTFPVPDVPVPPIAIDDAYTVNGGSTLTVPVRGVLINDVSIDQYSEGWTSTSIDGSVAVVSGPSNGVLNQLADGSFTYTPTLGFAGIDTYVYKIATTLTKADQAPVTLEDTATVTITVNSMSEITVTKVWADNTNAAGLRPTSVQVQLYQNALAYGDPVTLSSENNWSHTFTQLPVGDGAPFTYTAAEITALPGYATTYSADTFTITNTLLKNRIQVIKIDGRDEQTRLPGAVFELHAAIVSDQAAQVGALLETLTTNASGVASTTGTYAPGTYFLVEKTAPVGFHLIANPIQVVMAAGSGQDGLFTVRVYDDFDNNPAISVNKLVANFSHSGPAVDLAALYVGETARYTVTVTNSGNVQLNNVTVTDNMAAVGSAVRNVTAGTNLVWIAGTTGKAALNLGSLAAGASITLTYDYIAVSADLAREPITNTATVSGTLSQTADYPNGATVMDDDSAVIAVDDTPLSRSSLAVVKLVENLTNGNDPSDLASGMPGAVFRFTVIISNTGSLDLSNVLLTDSMALVGSSVHNDTAGTSTVWSAGVGGIATLNIGNLAAGDSRSFSYDYASGVADVGEVLNNIAVLKGDVTITLDDPTVITLSDTDDASIVIDQLPLTGETGNDLNMLIGFALLYAAAVILIYRRRFNRRNNQI